MPYSSHGLRPRLTPEHAEQKALIKWARANAWREPALRWLFSIPNGARVTPAQAGKLKAEGMTPGVPDLFLPVVCSSCSLRGHQSTAGLFIEMKSAKGTQSAEQRDFEAFVSGDYLYALCRSWVTAARVIVQYLQDAGGTKARVD